MPGSPSNISSNNITPSLNQPAPEANNQPTNIGPAPVANAPVTAESLEHGMATLSMAPSAAAASNRSQGEQNSNLAASRLSPGVWQNVPNEIKMAILNHLIDPRNPLLSVQRLMQVQVVNKNLCELSKTLLTIDYPALQATAYDEKVAPLANDDRLSDAEFTTEIIKLFKKSANIRVDLTRTTNMNRKQIMLDSLSQCTNVRTLSVIAARMRQSSARMPRLFPNPTIINVLIALTNVNASNPGVKIHLDARGTNLDTAAVFRLATIPGLVSLDVSGNMELGDVEAGALATLPLTSLKVDHANLTAAGAIALAGIPTLTELSMASNFITVEAAEALAAILPRLTLLDIRQNSFDDDQLATLAAARTGQTVLRT